MSFIEENKELQFGKPDPRKKWNRQGKRDARRNERKKRDTPVRDFFYKLAQQGIFGEKQKACSQCGNKRRATKLWRKEVRKRDRNWR